MRAKIIYYGSFFKIIIWLIESSKEQHLFEIEIFCNINDWSIYLFKKKNRFWYGSVCFKSNHYKKPNCLTPLTLSINIVAGPEVSDGAHEVVDCAQTHKFCNGPIGPLSQRIQSLSVSALSLEEQKILQSLERLNQRLQCQFHFKIMCI